MKIAFLGQNSSNKYSGGRQHALIMAETFAYLGYEVDYFTNNKQIFIDLDG